MKKITSPLTLALALAAAPLPAIHAQEAKAPTKVEAVTATVIRKNSTGAVTGKVSSKLAVIDGDLDATLALNVGTAEKPHYWTIFISRQLSEPGILEVQVADTAALMDTSREGNSSVSPITLFQITAPFAGSGSIAIYEGTTESMQLEIVPAPIPAKADPATEQPADQDDK